MIFLADLRNVIVIVKLLVFSALDTMKLYHHHWHSLFSSTVLNTVQHFNSLRHWQH